ncbi:hypothetical protein [Oceanivirga salmonicida]|uniref:hypothetical protein n=1 Tax=Oceanivirga salmonicida TaxID=1769291 RepID=UPI0012E17E7C|nr:hypothetical protein [Oceanivirga salmonicida]
MNKKNIVNAGIIGALAGIFSTALERYGISYTYKILILFISLSIISYYLNKINK